MPGEACYNIGVAENYEKKEITIGMKVSASLRRKIEEIAGDEDRPVGYVARELMVRGLALFLSDGKLRDDKLSGNLSLKPAKSERIVNGKLLAPQSMHKIPIKKEKPAHKKVA